MEWHHILDDVFDMLQTFYHDYKKEETFISYFKLEWESKLGK